MIITIDLSAPRKKYYDAINRLIFDLKMRRQLVNKYRNATLLAIISLAIKNGAFLIADTALLGSKFNIYNMGKFIELYGIPNFYYRIELMKIRENIFQSLEVIKIRGSGNLRVLISNNEGEKKEPVFQEKQPMK
ncbi:hypothetical protein [Clostridium thermarum]|uniref:hypothetical protein n=1 Tax=Clostridium thermarum TaxID=1716543 RepID=UPI00111DEED5|nr:hypothetical protein [Clostridium thermarum]